MLPLGLVMGIGMVWPTGSGHGPPHTPRAAMMQGLISREAAGRATRTSMIHTGSGRCGVYCVQWRRVYCVCNGAACIFFARALNFFKSQLCGACMPLCRVLVVFLNKRLFFQSLLATLTKATADMASALTIAAFDASAADTSSATSAAASPPNPAPLDAGSDHSDDAEFYNPIANLRVSIGDTPSFGYLVQLLTKIARAILSFLRCALAHSVLGFHTNK